MSWLAATREFTLAEPTVLCWNERGENKCLLLSISAVLTPLALLYEGL